MQSQLGKKNKEEILLLRQTAKNIPAPIEWNFDQKPWAFIYCNNPISLTTLQLLGNNIQGGKIRLESESRLRLFFSFLGVKLKEHEFAFSEGFVVG